MESDDFSCQFPALPAMLEESAFPPRLDSGVSGKTTHGSGDTGPGLVCYHWFPSSSTVKEGVPFIVFRFHTVGRIRSQSGVFASRHDVRLYSTGESTRHMQSRRFCVQTVTKQFHSRHKGKGCLAPA